MDTPADTRLSALLLEAPVRFGDRWDGRVAAVEVDEAWEVINVIVKRGFLRWTASVKLPFAAAALLSQGRLAFDFTSTQAFAREVPPVAAPARPLSEATPLSIAGARLEGLLVEPGRRFATGVIIRRGLVRNRVGIDDLSFEGKALHISTHGDDLPIYLSDAQLEDQARAALADTRTLTSDERRNLNVDVSGGVVTVRGNVRSKNARIALARALSAVANAATVRLAVRDDLELELAIGQALERAGFTHSAQVYARSALGEVTLYGEAPSAQAAEDIARAVSRVPGVRSVRTLLNIRHPQPVTSVRRE